MDSRLGIRGSVLSCHHGLGLDQCSTGLQCIGPIRRYPLVNLIQTSSIKQIRVGGWVGGCVCFCVCVVVYMRECMRA